MNLYHGIRRALTRSCHYDFLAVHRWAQAQIAWPQSRPAMARVLAIIGLFHSRKSVNCSTLAAKFSCSTKTIQRDMDFLRKQLSAPIRWDASRLSYYLDGEFRFIDQLKEAA